MERKIVVAGVDMNRRGLVSRSFDTEPAIGIIDTDSTMSGSSHIPGRNERAATKSTKAISNDSDRAKLIRRDNRGGGEGGIQPADPVAFLIKLLGFNLAIKMLEQ